MRLCALLLGSSMVLALTSCGVGEVADEDEAAELSADLTSAVAAGTELEALTDVNLRSGPSTSRSILLVVPAGARAFATGDAPVNKYFKVTFEGTTGWSHGAYYKVVPKAATRTYVARGTGYYPDDSPMEGGYYDRKGAPLHTLQDFLAGKAPYVSTAMDVNAFAYGTKMRITELEQKYGRVIEFRVVDTGSAFKGMGTSRIDICTANAKASLDATVNGTLHLVVEQ